LAKHGRSLTPRRRLGEKELQLVFILFSGTRWSEWSASRSDRALSPVGEVPEPVWTHRLQQKFFASVRDRTPFRHYTD
jgi:hypothetical protein